MLHEPIRFPLDVDDDDDDQDEDDDDDDDVDGRTLLEDW